MTAKPLSERDAVQARRPFAQRSATEKEKFQMNKEEAVQITLSMKDFVIGTAIAFLMLFTFFKISSGHSLIVTFVPGVVFSFGVFTWLYAKKNTLTRNRHFDSHLFHHIFSSVSTFHRRIQYGFSSAISAIVRRRNILQRSVCQNQYGIIFHFYHLCGSCVFL